MTTEARPPGSATPGVAPAREVVLRAGGSRPRIGLVAAATCFVSLAHYLTPAEHFLLHNIYQRLYYIPILLACAWFGLRGGLLTAAACAALYAPHILVHWRHIAAYQTNQLLELVLFGVIALVAGALSDRERSLRQRAEATAAERDRALNDLQETLETLRRSDRLVTLGTLAAAMAHEIRNPLAAMRGATEILDRDYPPGHPRREFLDILRREMEHLIEVTGKYLEYGKPQPPELRPTDLNATIRSVAGLLRRSAQRAGVVIETRLEPDLPPALADPTQLHQALVNLFLNGIQAMRAGGRLEVTTGCAPSALFVEVRDYGPGLPEGPTERLFEPFFTTKPGGSGLGLAVTRRIVEDHGGRIEAASAEGGGARFRIELQAAPAGAVV